MPNQNIFQSIDAPSFAGEATSYAVKLLDKLDFFENDDLIAIFPFGKAVKGIFKRADFKQKKAILKAIFPEGFSL